jgi:CheY-like chemotaxis protein
VEAMDGFIPDVVLIDIGLPGMSGYDLARRIRKDPRFQDVLLIAQTGWGREEDRRSAQEAGFDYHMIKPVEPDEIIKLLARLADD